ncbi:complement C1r subcomponent-like protein isoform X2 [Ursus arctos]|uniref:complement C1r subcomponent-like protein isoform X2 n=1 Tax=Ursus arctos TaxID=9644 RepID=UPI0020183E0C|nr:complement C1r subcomponent-like protein isoform X2 [Ursus arctos]
MLPSHGPRRPQSATSHALTSNEKAGPQTAAVSQDLQLKARWSSAGQQQRSPRRPEEYLWDRLILSSIKGLPQPHLLFPGVGQVLSLVPDVQFQMPGLRVGKCPLEKPPLHKLPRQDITASGMDPSRFCGQQGSPLGSPPGQREFVSPGNRLRLTFRAPASSQDGTTGLHKGFLALYQAVGVTHSRPIGQARGASEATSAPGDHPSRIQNACREPYYQAVPTGTLTCTPQGPWKGTQDGEELPHCVPVCGRPVTPIAQNQEALGSSRAKLGNFPWQAFTNIYGRGGGALLGDRWILTAAHTIYPKDGIFLGRNRSVDVFLGHTSIDEMLRLGSHPVRRVVVHPDYRQHESHNFDGDIALLELQRAVPLGPSLLPVCLPERQALYRSGVWGYVSGFGVDRGWLTTELKYSRLPVAPRAACQAWLLEKQRSEVFSANMFCAGDKMRQQSVCQGDSGGVYVVWDERAHHWVATGIVSWGVGCGKGYGFYTKVLNYLDWIKGVMDGKD